MWGGGVGALVQGSRCASGEQEAHVFRVVTSGSTCVPQLNVARCGEPSSGGVARRALTNVGLRRCWLLGDSRRGRLLGVGEGVFTRRLGEERFSDGVGEGVARGPGEVRFNSSVGVDGREPKVRVAPDRSPTVPRPAAPEPASVWSAWRKQTIAEAGQALAIARPWCGRGSMCMHELSPSSQPSFSWACSCVAGRGWLGEGTLMGTFRRLLDIAPLPRARGTGGDGRGACAETQERSPGMVGSHRVGGEILLEPRRSVD